MNNQGKSNIAIIGPKDIFQGLSALGINILYAEKEYDVERYLSDEKILKKHRIIFITETLASGVIDIVHGLNQKDYNIVLIPDNRGSLGLASERASDLFKIALGGEITK